MAGLIGTLTDILVSRLSSTTDGVTVRANAIARGDSTVQAAGIRAILTQNASVDITEKAGYAQYPALLVYCDRMSNTLTEKFRRLSGRAHAVVEVRHSQDRIETIETNLQVYVDAVCALLDDSRGDWGSGLFYTGGYDVVYEPVTRGGKNFLQRAKVGFDVEVSK
ncbi:MAG: hypothetical protein M3N93_02850 [Acidobacteriota bacterium]|nr:hypothetical protein [Acidobacteriota bacterium]